jgi:hypothetical protein
MRTYLNILCFWLFFFGIAKANIGSISILTNQDNLDNPLSGKSIHDCIELLSKACACEVRVNNPDAEIVLQLPEMTADNYPISRFEQSATFPYLSYPNHDYSWYSQRLGDQILMQLQTPSYQGISCGLYGLLQEQLWFSFYHPKEINIPNLKYWPLTETFYWHAKARFDKKGFHLHTMHPIELTEALLDVNFKNGEEEIRKYIDWLVRNGQNYFEFNVLNTIDTARWGTYMSRIVEYANSRGVIMGVDISMNMKQQKAYKLYEDKLFSSKGKKEAEIRANLAAICDKPKWGVVNMEGNATEFSTGNTQKRQAYQQFIHQILVQEYKIKLMGRKHVVKDEKMRAGKINHKPLSEAEQKLDKARGVLVHTVMFYGLGDTKAPVYENENFAHLTQLLKTEQTQRETWYFPESAYWITFDNSVPMLLLPYLSARLRDIELLDSMQVKGHITFSSGWEWGYWLVDWSIARWSWQHEINGQAQKNNPVQYIGDIFKRERITRLFSDMMYLQETYLKDKELIRYMCPSSVTDEFPSPLNMEFQPRPQKSYHWWRYKSKPADIEEFRNKVLIELLEFSRKGDELLQKLVNEERLITDPSTRALFSEQIRGLKVTHLRAKHRYFTLSYLVGKRLAGRDKIQKMANLQNLEKAKEVRKEAQLLVNQQELAYRYATDLIARALPPQRAHAAYDFGYLYTVSNLHFWEREEAQYETDNYSPFFGNIFNLAKIMGWEK